MRPGALLLVLLLCAPTPTLADGTKYVAVLDPAPLTFATRNDVAGTGSVMAELSGNTMTVNGGFKGLPSPVTTAQLRSGSLMGVPGETVADLTVPHAPDGTIAASVKVNRAVRAALKRGGLYVQLNSEKAPSGILWGWFVPAP